MSVKNIKESLRSSADKKTSIKFCQNHHDRLATHQLILNSPSNTRHYQMDSDNADEYFCQKCSIMLASQGFNVIKLLNHSLQSNYKDSNSKKKSYHPTNRKAQIQNFMNKLSSELNQLISTDQFVCQYLMQAEDYYGNIMKEVNEYFKQLQQVLELNKYRVYNTLLNNRTKGQEELREYRSILQENKRELIDMMDDIEGNMDTVETTSQEMFTAIMSGYGEKLAEIYEISQNPPQLKQLTFSIKIPDFPKQLQNISENFAVFYPELGTMPSSHASYQFRPVQYRSNLPNEEPITQNNNRLFSSNKSIYRQNSNQRNDNTLSIEQSDEGESVQDKQRNSKQNNKNIINVGKQLRRSFGGSLGFSFEESDDNFISDKEEYKLKGYERGESSDDMEYSDYAVSNGTRKEGLNKIAALNPKQVMQSRESLGKYLNLSHSREASIEDTDTLLIV